MRQLFIFLFFVNFILDSLQFLHSTSDESNAYVYVGHLWVSNVSEFSCTEFENMFHNIITYRIRLLKYVGIYSACGVES